MAESTTVLEQSSEPDKYFKGKQWYSAKRGEWIGGNIYFSYENIFPDCKYYIYSEGLTDKTLTLNLITEPHYCRSKPGDQN